MNFPSSKRKTTIENVPDYRKYRCPICKGNNFKRVTGFGIFSHKQVVCVCRNCGVICFNPRWTEERLARYYASAEYYGALQQTVDLQSETLEKALADTRAQQHYQNLKAHLEPDRKILEVGCGKGYNLAVLKHNGLNNVMGIDPSLECCQAAEKFGIPCIHATLGKFVLTRPDMFDCVILSGVLEHFTEPDLALNTINQIIRPGGILYLMIPDYYGTKEVNTFGMPHLTSYSKVTISMLLNNTGFKVVQFCDKPIGQLNVIALNDKYNLYPILECPEEYQHFLKVWRSNKPDYLKRIIKDIINRVYCAVIMSIFSEKVYLTVGRSVIKFLKR